MIKNYSKLILELEEIGLEQISEMMMSKVCNDKKRILVDGIYYSDNIRYKKKDFINVKGNTKQEEFYIRSDGDENTNILLYSQVRRLLKDGHAGAFSIGSAFNEDYKEVTLCICQIINYSKIKQLRSIFNYHKMSFREFKNDNFSVKTGVFFLTM